MIFIVNLRGGLVYTQGPVSKQTNTQQQNPSSTNNNNTAVTTVTAAAAIALNHRARVLC